MTAPGAEISRWVVGFVGESPLFDGFIRMVVNDYLLPVVMALVLVGLWFGARDPQRRERNQRAVIRAAVAVGWVNLAIHVINRVDFWPRPFEVYAEAARAADLLFYRPPDPSFPSNPAAVGFAFATGVWLGNRGWGAFLYGVALLWSFSRVYAGIVYPIDILGGALLALVIVFLTVLFLRLLEPFQRLFLWLARELHLA